MEDAEKEFAAQVAKRLDALDTNAFAVEQAAGLPEDAVRSILRGRKKSGTALNKAKAVCEALGLEFYIGPKRHEPTHPTVKLGDTSDSDYALIRTTLVEAAAGTGTYIDRVEDTEPLAFRKDWLSRIGVAADKAILLRAKGHSMQPLIWDGDMLLIDTSKTSPRIRPRGRSFPGGPQDEIFVLRMDDDVRVKAIKRPAEDQVMIYSENRDRFDPEILTGAQLNDLVIIGKVVWYGHVTS